MKFFLRTTILLFSLGILFVPSSAQDCPTYEYTTITNSAVNATGLNATIAEFRQLLGGENNGNSPGPLTTGHRSINWDAPIVPFVMPFDFFNTRVPRGAVFNTAGNQFRFSNPAEEITDTTNDTVGAPSVSDDKFNSILPVEVSAQLKTFSPERLFTPLNSRSLVVLFRIPGSATTATVSGFGAVFTDVDNPWATKMNYYDRNGCLIASVSPPAWNGGLSFAGIVVRDTSGWENIPVIYKVVITLGDVVVSNFTEGWGAEGETGRDVVVLDDLIYGEPTVMA